MHVTTHKHKYVPTLLIASVVVILLFVPQLAFAADALAALGNALLGGAAWAADKTIGLGVNAIVGVIFFLTTFLVKGSALLLDAALQFSFEKGVYELPGVVVGWEIFRDLANLTFIFILLYIASMFILGLADVKAKKALITLVIVALLVNFSFFLTGVVIDIGNVLTGFVYNEVTANGTESLGGTFVGRLGVAELLEAEDQSLNNFQEAGFKLLGIIFNFIAFTVLIAGAVIMITRTVILLFLIIVSPIAFAAAILPKTQKIWTEWVDKLIGNAFVGFVYVLMLAVTIAITESTFSAILKKGDDVTLARALNIYDDPSNFGVAIGAVLQFALIIGFLLASVVVAKKIANAAGSMGATAGGAAAGAVLSGGSRTVRFGAHHLNRVTQQRTNPNTRTGRVARATTGFLANRTYDPRANRVGRFVAGQLKQHTGIDVGTARTSAERRKETQDRTKERREQQSATRVNNANVALRNATAGEAHTILESLTPNEVSKLSPDILTTPQVGVNLDPRMLGAIAANRDLQLNQAQRQAIYNHATSRRNANYGGPNGANAQWYNLPAGQALR